MKFHKILSLFLCLTASLLSDIITDLESILQIVQSRSIDPNTNATLMQIWPMLTTEVRNDIIESYAVVRGRAPATNPAEFTQNKTWALQKINGNFATQEFEDTMLRYLSFFPSYRNKRALFYLSTGDYDQGLEHFEFTLRAPTQLNIVRLDPLLNSNKENYHQTILEIAQLIEPDIAASLQLDFTKGKYIDIANNIYYFRMRFPQTMLRITKETITKGGSDNDLAKAYKALVSVESPLIFQSYTLSKKDASIELLAIYDLLPITVQTTIQNNFNSIYSKRYNMTPITDPQLAKAFFRSKINQLYVTNLTEILYLAIVKNYV